MNKNVMPELNDAQKQKLGASFLKTMLFLICFYIFCLDALFSFNDVTVQSTTWISAPIILVTIMGMIWIAVKSNLGRAFFYLHFQRPFLYAAQGVLLSIPFLLLALGIKWYLIQHHINFQDQPLFKTWSHEISFNSYVIPVLVYVILVPIQEFVRVVTQNSLLVVFTGRWRVFRAILTTAIIFSLSHAHMSISLYIEGIALLLGLAWGGLMYYQKSLIGAIVSHLLVGFAAFYLIGFEAIFD